MSFDERKLQKAKEEQEARERLNQQRAQKRAERSAKIKELLCLWNLREKEDCKNLARHCKNAMRQLQAEKQLTGDKLQGLL